MMARSAIFRPREVSRMTPSLFTVTRASFVSRFRAKVTAGLRRVWSRIASERLPRRFSRTHDDLQLNAQCFATPGRQRMYLAWAIEDQPATFQEPVIFLAFHAIHYDQLLAATQCRMSHAFAVRAEKESVNPVIFLACHTIHYDQLLPTTLCYISHAFTVRAENGTPRHNPVIFLACHTIHYDQLLAATQCRISHAFAVRAEKESVNPVIFLACHTIHYDQLLPTTLCYISHAFTVRAENGSALPNRVIFLAFHPIHYDP